MREIMDISHSFGTHIWDSSLVFAAFIFSNKKLMTLYLDSIISDQQYHYRLRKGDTMVSVLELGAGCGLAGILFARLFSSRSQVVLTDHVGSVLHNLTNQIILNELQKKCRVLSLDWGRGKEEIEQDLECPDLLLGADVFYDPSLFESLLETVSWFIRKKKTTLFLTTYQERSSKRSLSPLLKKYHLKGIFIANGQMILDTLKEKDSVDLQVSQGLTLESMKLVDYETINTSIPSVFLFCIMDGNQPVPQFIMELVKRYDSNRQYFPRPDIKK
jgi:hypothetical protein